MGKIWDQVNAVEEKKEEPKKESSFLIGQPKRWSQITEDGNKKEWIWENYVSKGHVTLLSALWKAGKSTLLRHLFLSIAKEEEFAGQPTIKSRILILSEEAESEWLQQKEELTPDEIDHIEIWSRPIRIKPNLKQWVQLIDETYAYCVINKVDMVVIDTLTTFWPIDNENDSAQVIKALVPLYTFSENNIAVLLVHHFRKGGGDQAQASRGSGALPGFVDNIIEFTRNDNGLPTQRVLKTYGRFDEVIPSVVIDLTSEGVYKTLGNPWEVSKSARMQKILDILHESTQPMTAKEVYNSWSAEGLTVNLRSIQRYIKELTTGNILEIVKEEVVARKNVPFYAQTGTYKKQTTIDGTVTLVPVVSPVTVVRLSPVNEKQARTDDTTGTSPNREWEDPDPRW